MIGLSVKRVYQATIILLIIVIACMGYQYLDLEKSNPLDSIDILDPMEPPFNPVKLGVFLDETTQIGSLSIVEAKVVQNGNPGIVGYGMVYCLERTGTAYPEGYDEVFLLDSENRFIPYPLDLKTSTIALELNNVIESEEISVEGDLYNCSAWDGSWFLALRVDNQYIYSVKPDPKPLTASQVELYTDSDYYHVNDTARVTIRNLSEDWLKADRTLWMYKKSNGTWIKDQSYPDGYLITLESVLTFPGSSWSHDLPLTHLSPGTYRLVKEVSHPNSPKIKVETHFTIIEELVDYSNSTHIFGLESINCTLPEVPDVIPIARRINVPINSTEAEEIAVEIFGFTEPYKINGDVNPSFRSDEKRLEFSTRYDIMYHGAYPESFNNWNKTEVIEIAENFLAKLEPYWVDDTAINYSYSGISPSHISSSSPLTQTIREVGVRYQNMLDGISLSGPGADFSIHVCRDHVSSCEIRRPVVNIEGYTNVTVSPIEAVQMMLRGESATPSIGFEVLQMVPRGGLLTVNSVQLIYYTSLDGEWLIPVYEIKCTAKVDPVLFDRETTEIVWYIYATDYKYPQIE